MADGVKGAPKRRFPKPGFTLPNQGIWFLVSVVFSFSISYFLYHNLLILASAMLLAVPIYCFASLWTMFGRYQAAVLLPDQLFAEQAASGSIE